MGEVTDTGEVLCKIFSTIGFELFMNGIPAFNLSAKKYRLQGSDTAADLEDDEASWESGCDKV